MFCSAPSMGLIQSGVSRSDVFLVKRKSTHETKMIRQMAKAIRLMCVR
jgi:hypothetical protein